MSEPSVKKGATGKKNVKRLKKAVFLLLLVVCIGGLYLFWLKLQQPAVGIVRVGTGAPESVPVTKIENKRYSGHFVSFSVPGHFVEKSHTLPTNGPVRETIFLSSNESEGKKIAVVVEDRPNGSLEESPSFIMRLMKPKIYKSEVFTIGEAKGTMFFKDSQVYEATAFFRFYGKVVSVSVSSPIRSETLREDLEALLASIQWAE